MAFPLTPAQHHEIEARILALPELIVAAAVRTPLGTITRDRPARHGDLWALLPRGLKSDDPDVTHGFMTSRGRFVDRQEAARLVVETGQGSPRFYEGYVPALHSEDMWLDLFELPAPSSEAPPLSLKEDEGLSVADSGGSQPQEAVKSDGPRGLGGGEPSSKGRPNTDPNWANCPSTHCERRQECCSPSDCTVKATGRRALLPAFRAHVETMYGGPLPNWPDDPLRWDERYGGLPYSAVLADRFRDFMAGFDAAALFRSSEG